MKDTERIIMEATIELLLKDGKFGVSMSEIAQKSKISRTVIHYYFRSRERLFDLVNQEIVEKIITPRYQKLFDHEHLKIKIENFLTESEKSSIKFPYADIYIMTEFAKDENIRNYFYSIKPSMENLLIQINNATVEKNIVYSDALFFLLDLLTLSSYSLIYLNFLKTNNILPSLEGKDLFLDRNEMIRKILTVQDL